MALRTDPYGNIFCSECNSRLDPRWSVGAFIATMFIADILTWVLAGFFVLLGLLWEPAYIIAGCIVLLGIYRASKNQQRFVCTNCKREFSYEQVHGN